MGSHETGSGKWWSQRPQEQDHGRVEAVPVDPDELSKFNGGGLCAVEPIFRKGQLPLIMFGAFSFSIRPHSSVHQRKANTAYPCVWSLWVAPCATVDMQ